ncbi:DNA-binding protein [Curtobacterium sp. SGAir0471]|uniref:helix-turn-helix domain-containing protein n=1 Tax=Curtobacterium sp. SGAir0471 TaxID=2070337 RepID=UPI0010CCE4E1|nr:XRE family transcriptional regulator [Curtobacterium sp. SGAir0471]QCR42811.1 DNA-binding protein [Curtobacterium sp. SGAir0471]
MRVERAAELIRAAREDVGLSQSALATAAGMQQPSISAYESGRKQPRPETLQRILRAARARPSIPLALYADDVLRAAERFHLRDVRVFGSAVRGEDTEQSDVDLLVGLAPGASLFDLGGFAAAVEDLLGFAADVLTDDLVGDEHFRHVLDEAVPL